MSDTPKLTQFPDGYLSEQNISHDSLPFKRIQEIHGALWAFVRIAVPGASGYLDNLVGPAYDELATLRTQLKESAEREAGMKEAFYLEDDKVEKARDFILNQKCSCTGEGVGTPGGCDRCRALNYLSTFGWDFRMLVAARKPCGHIETGVVCYCEATPAKGQEGSK